MLKSMRREVAQDYNHQPPSSLRLSRRRDARYLDGAVYDCCGHSATYSQHGLHTTLRIWPLSFRLIFVSSNRVTFETAGLLSNRDELCDAYVFHIENPVPVGYLQTIELSRHQINYPGSSFESSSSQPLGFSTQPPTFDIAPKVWGSGDTRVGKVD